MNVSSLMSLFLTMMLKSLVVGRQKILVALYPVLQDLVSALQKVVNLMETVHDCGKLSILLDQEFNWLHQILRDFLYLVTSLD